ncbi:NAD-glutamate dehydrogenase [Rhodococcus sp. KBS0724]|uniref:NAD-glutamate dehydrogenase domain-containing protein n=1 Tax=Rhodococcus sp. KBS0724 TaxID=1179674 RepID=UPI00110D782C|nr:NAD-glutamate dehydrogenase domain-containing protein [Rhodococcus sp. KBS0724]TSD45184.1 NAD-glutamate dehydrogenase [Rhodococcus sp. KBS0724]
MASTSTATKSEFADTADPALGLVAELAAAGQRLVFRQGDELTGVVLWPSGEPSLSDLCENFESLGLRVSTHRPLPTVLGSAHHFTFEPCAFDGGALEKMAAAFEAVVAGRTRMDNFSSLIGRADITWRDAELLRAACRFLAQARIGLSEGYVVGVLGAKPVFVRAALGLFSARFDPAVPERAAAVAAAVAEIDESVERADTLDEDRVLRGVRSFLQATLRTNWYLRDDAGNPLPHASFKIDSKLLSTPQKTVPFREIYVSAPNVEGVHLRSSSVARGGLRWSDRFEDFRTEALSLMKTQSVKNSPIVPTGAKGAFVVRGTSTPTPAQVQESYSTFIRGLLDVVDNIVDGSAVHPAEVIAYDGEDSYLVVAADKGTARFSDVANGIAIERGFWLGDAFASGGSAGYDHKAMGITARGAWVAVRRHFAERGVDVDTDPFTVAGIGDMSGDVFGNGMLLSHKIRLVAAFDHRHIFIDPNPDMEATLRERARLFTVPRSSWDDFDRTVMSPGGGVWPRSAKSISLPREARDVLGITEEKLTPQELIRAILCAPVELLWNGGVGTYVKASAESNVDAADPSNDGVRVSADELRAAVVGEGGNLGFTQRARIEYAAGGGRINADFIDNAAGVATSDREVNIKIALAELDSGSRNALLASAQDEVAVSVLKASEDQTLAISLAEHRAPALLDQHERLIENLIAAGAMKRLEESLPDAKALAARARAGQGLLRPELAVLVAQSKNVLTAELGASDAPDNKIFADRLTQYFPPSVVQAAPEAVKAHRLGRDIIITSVVDELVNRVGPGVLFRLEEHLGVRSPEASLAYAVVSEVLGTEDLRRDILNSDLDAAEQLQALDRLQQLLESEMSWVLRRPGAAGRFAVNPRADIDRWAGPVRELIAGLTSSERIEVSFGALALADLALQENTSVLAAATVYRELAAELDLGDVLGGVDLAVGASHWEVMGGAAVHARLTTRFADLVSGALDDDRDGVVQRWSNANPDAVHRFTTLMSSVRRSGPLDTARLCTVDAELELLIRGASSFSSAALPSE